jgi:hypothetical protein
MWPTGYQGDHVSIEHVILLYACKSILLYAYKIVFMFLTRFMCILYVRYTGIFCIV